MPENVEPEISEPVPKQITQVIENLRTIKSRLPPILAVVEELKLVSEEGRLPMRNSIVFQMARDSFDMLSVDLDSLREQMLSRKGILNGIRRQPERFRRFGAPDGDTASRQSGEQKLLLKARNDALDRLFPGGSPTLSSDFDALDERFRALTQAIHDDRDKSRAHRYEVPAKTAQSFYLPPERMEGEIDAFERFAADLLLVLENQGHSFSATLLGDPRHTAADLADIIIRGSINDACLKYDVTKVTPEDDRPWYWAKREAYFKNRQAVPKGAT